MKNVIFINACVRGEVVSRTLKIARAFLGALDKNVYNVKELNLMEENIEYLSYNNFGERDAMSAGESFDDDCFDYAKDFAGADRIVIAAPFWQFGYPAILSTYLENVSVAGITFRYIESGSEGLCKAEKMMYITTAGGDFSLPQLAHFKIGHTHLKTLCRMYGIGEFEDITAEGLDILGADVEGIIKSGIDRAIEKAIKF